MPLDEASVTAPSRPLAVLESSENLTEQAGGIEAVVHRAERLLKIHQGRRQRRVEGFANAVADQFQRIPQPLPGNANLVQLAPVAVITVTDRVEALHHLGEHGSYIPAERRLFGMPAADRRQRSRHQPIEAKGIIGAGLLQSPLRRHAM